MALSSNRILRFSSAVLAATFGASGLTGCATPKPQPSAAPPPMPAAQQDFTPKSLPTKYATPAYTVRDAASSKRDELSRAAAIKRPKLAVGASIQSDQAHSLADILKRLVSLKKMTVSWASDADPTVKVEVSIQADDDFYDVLDNLLRQADYFYELQGNTVIVKYKETREYHLPIPNTRNAYSTSVGGNFLATERSSSSGSTQSAAVSSGTKDFDPAKGDSHNLNVGSRSTGIGSVKGVSQIESLENSYNIWEDVNANLNLITKSWAGYQQEKARRERVAAEQLKQDLEKAQAMSQIPGAAASSTSTSSESSTGTAPSGARDKKAAQQQEDLAGGFFTIDKSLGIIRVTAPRSVLEKVDAYVATLKERVFRQISIEAKVIEVFLNDSSKVGLDWSTVLKNFKLTGTTSFGNSGVIFDRSANSGSLISKVAMNDASMSVLLSALNEQGRSKVLSNPKLTVMNGQPALISIGKSVSYVSKVTVETDSEAGTKTYSPETSSVVDGLSLGVVASIGDNKKTVLQLTPITTEIVGGTVEYIVFGDGSQVGVPVLNLREMNTTVSVDDGEMLIIGGLIDEVSSLDKNSLPGTGNVPVIKYLFGAEEKIQQRRELVVVIVPHVQ